MHRLFTCTFIIEYSIIIFNVTNWVNFNFVGVFSALLLLLINRQEQKNGNSNKLDKSKKKQ
jgi:hypothetical protein